MSTYIWIEDFLYYKLKELFGNSSFINTLFSFKLHVQLFLQISWVLHGDHLQLKSHTNTSQIFKNTTLYVFTDLIHMFL